MNSLLNGVKKGWKLTKKTKNSVGWIHPSAQVSLEFSDLDDKPKSFLRLQSTTTPLNALLTFSLLRKHQ
jgi:hypothetical protein